MKVGAANPAGPYPQEHLTGARNRPRSIGQPQRPARPFEDHRAHQAQP